MKSKLIIFSLLLITTSTKAQDKPVGKIVVKRLPEKIYTQACVEHLGSTLARDRKSAFTYSSKNFNAETRCDIQLPIAPAGDTAFRSFDFYHFYQKNLHSPPGVGSKTYIDTVYIQFQIDQALETKKCQLVNNKYTPYTGITPIQAECSSLASELKKWIFKDPKDKPKQKEWEIYFVVKVIVSNRPLTILYEGSRD